MQTKTFKMVSSIAMIFTLVGAIFSVIGIGITGFYPGIVVLFLLTLIPLFSRLFAKKIKHKSNDFQKNYFRILSLVNALVIFVVLLMTFVILVDRVFPVILK